MINRYDRPRGVMLALLVVFTLGLSPRLLAQPAGQASPPASSPTPAASPQSQPATTQTPTESADGPAATPSQPTPDPKIPQNDRILWTLPNYLTVENSSSLPPLTAGQKFKLATEETFDPVEFGFVGLASGVNQATNANPTFGQRLKANATPWSFATTPSRTTWQRPYSLRCCDKIHATTNWEKGVFSTVSGIRLCGLQSRARTREKLNSTSLKSLVVACPQPSPMRIIPALGHWEAASTSGRHKLVGTSSVSR